MTSESECTENQTISAVIKFQTIKHKYYDGLQFNVIKMEKLLLKLNMVESHCIEYMYNQSRSKNSVVNFFPFPECHQLLHFILSFFNKFQFHLLNFFWHLFVFAFLAKKHKFSARYGICSNTTIATT